MIKSAIILVLLLLLLGGAFLSRPTKQNFETYVREQSKLNSQSFMAKVLSSWQVDSYLESITFNDRYLWVEVEQGGKKQFVGAFSKFFAVGNDKSTAAISSDGKATESAEKKAADGKKPAHSGGTDD